MPTYEYACRSCGSQLEAVQSFTDDSLTTCGDCGGALRKVFGAVGISFKGSGFYKTDSRKGSSPSSSGRAAKDRNETNDTGSKDAGSKEGASKDASSSKEPATTSSSGDGGSSSPTTSAKPAPHSR